MAENIISNQLPENIAKDLTVNEQGQIFVSRRGTARLSGVVQKTIQKILAKIEGDDQTAPKIFESFMGQSFQGDNLPDVLVSAIIKYFAYQGRETAQQTEELAYDYLPPVVYQEIKRCKAETGSYDKLHQFLADDGLKILEQHQRTLLTLMQASATLGQLKTLLDQSCTGTYQLLLVGA